MKEELEKVKEQLERPRNNSIFNAASSFNDFWNRKVYQNELNFNSVYLRYDLPKLKGWSYIINLGKYRSMGNNWIDM